MNIHRFAVLLCIVVGCAQDPEVAYNLAKQEFDSAKLNLEVTFEKHRNSRDRSKENVVKKRLGMSTDEIKSMINSVPDPAAFDDAMKRLDSIQSDLITAYEIRIACTTPGTQESTEFLEDLMSNDPDAAIECMRVIKNVQSAEQKLNAARELYLKSNPGLNP